MAVKIPNHIQQLIDATVNAAIRGNKEYKGRLLPESRREILADSLRRSWAKILEKQGTARKRKPKPRAFSFEDKHSAARGQQRILLNPPKNLVAGLREKVVYDLISQQFTRAERTAYLRKLVSANPKKSAAALFAIADRTVIGNMAAGTFANRVGAIRKDL
jgi:hypothetical protein